MRRNGIGKAGAGDGGKVGADADLGEFGDREHAGVEQGEAALAGQCCPRRAAQVALRQRHHLEPDLVDARPEMAQRNRDRELPEKTAGGRVERHGRSDIAVDEDLDMAVARKDFRGIGAVEIERGLAVGVGVEVAGHGDNRAHPHAPARRFLRRDAEVGKAQRLPAGDIGSVGHMPARRIHGRAVDIGGAGDRGGQLLADQRFDIRPVVAGDEQ